MSERYKYDTVTGNRGQVRYREIVEQLATDIDKAADIVVARTAAFIIKNDKLEELQAIKADLQNQLHAVQAKIDDLIVL